MRLAVEAEKEGHQEAATHRKSSRALDTGNAAITPAGRAVPKRAAQTMLVTVLLHLLADGPLNHGSMLEDEVRESNDQEGADASQCSGENQHDEGPDAEGDLESSSLEEGTPGERCSDVTWAL